MTDLLAKCIDLMQNYGGLGPNFAIGSCIQIFGTLFSPYVRFATVPDTNAKGELIPFRIGHILVAKPNLLKTRTINFVVNVVKEVWRLQLKKIYNLKDEEFDKLLPVLLINEGSMEAFAKNIDDASKGLSFDVSEKKKKKGKKGIEDLEEEIGIEKEQEKKVYFNQFIYFNDEFGKAFKSMTDNGDYSYKLLSMIAKLMTMATYTDNTLHRGRIYIDGKRVVINSIIGIQEGTQLEREFFEAGFSRRFLPIYETTKKQTNFYKLYSRDDDIVNSLVQDLYPIVEKMREEKNPIMSIPDGTDTEELVISMLEETNYQQPIDQYVPMFASVITALSGINYTGGDFTTYTYKDVQRIKIILDKIYIPSVTRLYNESLLSYNRERKDYVNTLSQEILKRLTSAGKVITWKEMSEILSHYGFSDAVETLVTLINSGEITCKIIDRKNNSKLLLFTGQKNDDLDDGNIAMCIREIRNRILH